MSFQGIILQKPNAGKVKIDIGSVAYEKVSSVDNATHIKLADSNQFVEITDRLIIRRKRDVDGNPTDDEVHFSRINKNEDFVCEIDGKEHEISPDFYTQIVLMNKSDKGNHLRCDDGTYVHKEELQIPAYKKLPQGSRVEKPSRNHQFYVENEILVIKENGKRIILTDEIRNRVRKEGDLWIYTDEKGMEYPCYYKKGLDTRTYINHVLLDNETIVDIRKLNEMPNGELVLTGINGEDVFVGKKEVALKQPVLTGETVSDESITFVADNILKQAGKLQKENEHVQLRRDIPDKNGIVMFNIHKTRNSVLIGYSDGTQVIYALEGVSSKNRHSNSGAKLVWVRDFKFIDLGEEGIRVEFKQIKHDIAKNVVLNSKNKIGSCELNGRKLTRIEWGKDGGYDAITSYRIDGVKISDITWDGEKIKTCKIHLIGNDGDEVIEELDDIYNSEYKDYAITQKVTNSIENLVTNNDKFSFKMGEYEFIDVELTDDKKIGKCKLKYNGVEEEVDLSTDTRFNQLAFTVNVVMDEQRITPLIQSRLLEKKDGKYELSADIIQTDEMSELEFKNGKITDETRNNGVSKATTIGSISNAIDAQNQFKQSPFKTVVIDKDGKVHTISDTQTKYECAPKFDFDKEILEDMVGDLKAEIKKGEIVIDAKKTNNTIDDLVLNGFALCGLCPITIIIGLPLLFVAGAIGAIAPLKRKAQKSKLTNKDVGKQKEEIQDNVAKKCKENINKLVADYKRELDACKKMYSQEQFNDEVKKLREDFKFKYMQEAAKLQILDGGEMICKFNPSEKTKLNPASHFAYLEYVRKRHEFENGKSDDPRLAPLLNSLKHSTALNEGERVLIEAQLLQQYGGKHSQTNAYLLKLNNIERFLDIENEKRKQENKRALSIEDYQRILRQEYNAGRQVWGGIEDKLEAFKESREYLRADKNERVKLLKDKREKLEKEAKSIKIESVEFAPRLGKDGKPLMPKYSQSIMAYMEYIDTMFTTGNIKGIKEFDYNFYSKLSDEDKEIYAPSNKLSDVSCKRVKTTHNRRIEFDQAYSENNYINKASKKREEVVANVEDMADQGERYRRIRDYEKLVTVLASLDAEEEKFANDCKDVEQIIAGTPNAELCDKKVAEIENEITKARTSYAKQKIMIERAKSVMQKQYTQQVKNYALDEFAKAHKTEYNWHVKYIAEMSKKDAYLDEASIQLSFFQSMCADKKKAEERNSELEAYKVQHHIEENVEAEVYAEINKDEFEKFVANNNVEGLNGEMMVYSFYAQAKKDNKVEGFKSLFGDKVRERLAQKAKDKKLRKHDKKIIKGKKTEVTETYENENSHKANRSARASAPAPALSSESEVVLTA